MEEMKLTLRELKNKLGELKDKEPIRYELTKDGKFVFELKGGEKVALACEKCGNTIWDTGVFKEKDELIFRYICHKCGEMIVSIGSKPK